MTSKHIIPGYKGIMDLDLTNIPIKFHKELVNLHMKDIDEYKLEQDRRSPSNRYENTVVKSEKYWKIYHIEQIYLSAQIKDQVFWPAYD